MTFTRATAISFFALTLGTGLASATAITVQNTGVNSSGVVQTIGSSTAFWTLFSKPVGATEALSGNPIRYFNGAYYADNANSGWVAPDAGGVASARGTYVYELAVDLTGFNLSTVSISGTFGTDNDGSISVNSSAAVATTAFAGFGNPTAFTINSGFVSGINEIKVTIDNGGGETAFRVQFSNATGTLLSGVPEPGVFALTGIGLIGFACLSRRRASRRAAINA